LISTVVMFQAQNRETINSTWKLLWPSITLWRRVWQDHVWSFTTQHQTCKIPRSQRARPILRPRPISLVSYTDGLRPHHWNWIRDEGREELWKSNRCTKLSFFVLNFRFHLWSLLLRWPLAASVVFCTICVSFSVGVLFIIAAGLSFALCISVVVARRILDPKGSEAFVSVTISTHWEGLNISEYVLGNGIPDHNLRIHSPRNQGLTSLHLSSVDGPSTCQIWHP